MKAVKMIICTFVVFVTLIIPVSGEEKQNNYNEIIDSAGVEEIYSHLDEKTKEALSEIGLEAVDFDSLFDVSFKDIFALVKNSVRGTIDSPLTSLVKLVCIIILVCVAQSFVPDSGNYQSVFNISGVLFSISVIIVPVYQAVESAISSMGVSAGFMKGLIPVLAGVISVSGNPTLALSFQSLAFGVAQVMSILGENYVIPVIGAVMAIDITGALMPEFKLSGITELIKKTLISTMSFCATLYVSFLGLKGALSNAADTVANKGIKLIISSAVPVVGGAVSEAYSGILGSLVLVRSTMGIFGIVAIALIMLPSMLQLLFWIFALKAGAAAGEVFGLGGISSMLKALSSALTLFNVVLLFNGVLFIISLALIITIKQ